MSETVNKTPTTFRERVMEALRSFGLPRLIIAGFLLLLFILAPFVNADLPMQITNTINQLTESSRNVAESSGTVENAATSVAEAVDQINESVRFFTIDTAQKMQAVSEPTADDGDEEA